MSAKPLEKVDKIAAPKSNDIAAPAGALTTTQFVPEAKKKLYAADVVCMHGPLLQLYHSSYWTSLSESD
eukprot:COSAG05_NODE_12104_length_483_cov_0.921875_1_plen_69_part_00